MKTLAKSALGVAVAVAAAVAATSVQASEAVTMDPSLTFTYKNYYFHTSDKEPGGQKTNDWPHALIADFDSGYVNDLVTQARLTLIQVQQLTFLAELTVKVMPSQDFSKPT